MDAVVIGALEEICFEGVKGLLYPQRNQGLTLHRLFPKIHSYLSSNGLHLCNNVKKVFWSNLLNIQSLRFECDGVSYDAGNPRIQSFEDAERMELKILAAEHLLKSFIGIHDHADVPEQYRRVLYRIAIARTNGVTQNDLAKELGIENKNIFYKVKTLESRGLIVRQSTLIWNKKVGNEGKYENGSTMNTNTLYLYRYAQHLGSLQRREITKEDKVCVDGDLEQGIKEDVHIKDYEPSLRAICDKLEKANDKVLIVSDIKKELGYCKTSGHRAWRNTLHKLKDAALVEEFYATVNNKKVSCLRLLKKFSPKSFAPKSYGGGDDDIDTEQHVKPAKRGQITEQLMELPIEQRIYDMIDAQGSKGLLLNEVYKRLGIKNKPYSPLILDMVSRSRIHLAKERLNRGVVNRAWTSRNFNTKVSDTLRGKSKDIIDEKFLTHAQVVSLEISSSASPPPRGRSSYRVYPQREQWILEKLQEKKVLIEPELHRLLENLEKKRTVRDKKTLERSLNKLQEQGHCKCISLAIPAVTDCGRKRNIDVVLHPSVYNAQDLLDRIQERLRSTLILNGIERIGTNVVKDQTETHETRRNNGFVSAKMRQKHKSEGAKSAEEPESHPSIPTPPSYKRKRSLKGKPVNNGMENVDEKLGKLKHAKTCIANDVTNERITALEDDEMHISIDELDGQKEVIDNLEQNAGEDDHSVIHKYARRKRFAWTENKDRQLVTEYLRNRAALGSKFHSTDWASLQSLPAPPRTCRRRMSTLNRNNQFRKAVTRLCNVLSVRYVKLLESSKNKRLGDRTNDLLNTKERWDDFDNKDIKMALDEVLQYKQVTNLKATKGYGMLMNGGKGFHTQTYVSLTVSNAIELLKLVSLSRKAPSLRLAETSRQYSEHDMQTAFNYLRERNFMVKGGHVSDVFTCNRCSSPYPFNTGERAVKMAEWVRERESDLLDEGCVDLYADVQCGDVLQLCVLMCVGEVSMCPCLPDEGVGEIEDSKKRDRDDNDFCKAKKPKLLDSEIFCRKEKGFPGIKLSLSRSRIPKVDALASFSGFGSGSNLEHELSKGMSLNGKSKWEDMACYAKHLTSLEVSPFLFQDVYSAIQEAGDQGLSMERISSMVDDVQGEKIAELIVEVLEAFGRALKVNGYDSIHFVDSKYRSKYFLLASSHQQHLDQKKLLLDKNLTKENYVHKSSDKVQRVAILNNQAEEVVMDAACCYKPILPWVDVDGTINENVYKGLVCRLLGIVMQNPGILEEHIIGHMNVLNPQSCRRLLEEMILDGHIMVRKMYEFVSNGPPSILVGVKKPKMVMVCKKHFFANLGSIRFL